MNAGILIKSKADQVVDYMTDWLNSGALKIGDKLPSERELAKRLGVSLLTVNKAMARLEDAQLLTRSAGRGTQVANLPSLDAISVICDIFHLTDKNNSPFFSAIVENLQEAAENGGIIPHFMIGRGQSADDFLKSLGFQSAVWRNITGAVAMAWRDGIEERFAEQGIPLVTISMKRKVKNSVILDYEEMGRMAATRILEKAPDKIHLVHNTTFDERCWNNPVSAFCEELEKQNFNTKKISFVSLEPNKESGEKLPKQLNGKATHIFFTDENIAAGYAEALKGKPSQNTYVITQFSDGIDLSIPGSFDKLGFALKDISAEALSLLKELRSPFHDKSRAQRFIKPVLIEGKKERSGNEN
jgi:DNA-binding transcriptional regulator YhcF (GntR family)